MTRLFKIKVLKWAEHNKDRKKSYKKTLISNNFCTDNKLGILPMSHRWLFLGLILTCGDLNRDTVELNPNQLRTMLGCNANIDRVLSGLQSLQLLTFEIIELPLIKRSEEKRKEGKRIPIGANNLQNGDQTELELSQKPVEKKSASPPGAKAPVLDGTNLVIAAYCDAWRERYKSEKSPPMLGHHAKQMKSLVQSVGKERAIILIQAYLQMPDSWFLTKRHDIPTFMANVNAVSDFSQNGRIITKREAQTLDRDVTNANTLAAIRAGDV